MLEALRALYVTVALVALFGVTVFVHELGHFLAARWLGLAVDVFSLGFGPALWKRRIRGVTYKVGSIPFGGYVALPQLDPTGMSRIQGGDRTGEGSAPAVLPPAAPWRKIVVSVAGAAGNVVLAIALAWVVFWFGRPAAPADLSAVVGQVDPGSAAYEAGLRLGDTVLAVNGTAVENWPDLMLLCAVEREVTLTVRTPAGEQKMLTVPTVKAPGGHRVLSGVDGRSLCQVLTVEPGMSAARAGMKAGDRIVRFAGTDVLSRAHLVDLVERHRDRPVSAVVMRGDKPLELTVTPAYDAATDRVRIGIRFNEIAVEDGTVVHPRPGKQLWRHASAIFRFLGALLTPTQARAAADSTGGPVAIVVSYWTIIKVSLMLALWFTGFLNVNLAIINLLPLPVLDGGHVIFSLWEMVFRRPLHPKVVNALVNTFVVLLILVFVLLTYRDVALRTPLGAWFQRRFAGDADSPAAAAPADEE